ncbi:hypothetical protein AAC387_Pa02g0051 [Persea americana]|eukprot:TRINITY_DN461_c0_g1_i2.p1 TRINITY_DN461_c0_g1~~TRINITY_DN461_c0_g1_i2.p1  ORF type:complete len:1369 (-),score=336.60 TRINITY_DN461_c0_g1_i2:372-4478(-)
MASSDDEGEAIPQSVTNYYFVDDKDEPISFSILPIQWGENDSPVASNSQIFLHGIADSGLQKVYKKVTAWKLNLSDEQPELSVLSKDHSCIKLLKPRKSYEDIIRSILITVHCLQFAKKNPESSDKVLWDQLRKNFSYEVRPSENDLLDHLPLISSIVKRDKELEKSKFLLAFIEKPKKRKLNDEELLTGLDSKKSKFIVDDTEDVYEEIEDADADESDEEPDSFDSVCAICDNGGELLCCEGKCLRSFHATKDAGSESECASLGMSKAQVKAIQNFLCANCQRKRHQCFACGKLGSSDKSTGAEVFPCVSATCGYFYHPECVAKLLHPGNEADAEGDQKKIAAGESFTCPVHKCHVCKKGENKEVEDLQFAICRRCPKAYHRKCMPRKIAFDDIEEEDIIQRAWDDLIPNRILIYCLKHTIDEDLGTPKRNHIIFPDVVEKKKVRPLVKKIAKRKDLVSEDSLNEKIATMKLKRIGEKKDVEEHDSQKMTDKSPSAPGELFKKSKETIASRKPLMADRVSLKVEKSVTPEDGKASVKMEKSTTSLPNKGSASVKSKPKDPPSGKHEKTVPPTSFMKSNTSLPVIDSETEKRIMAIVKRSSSSLTLEDIMKKHKVPSTHSYSSRHVDRTITQGKVEGSVEAVRTALQKLEEGCSIEDAKAVCGPDILNQIMKWKIVEKLHWYVQKGDMIVDFCCGANDFSRLMKNKLEDTGKECFFKNYDVIQPKDDFNFEKRDWMTVRQGELPTGSKLIMGLNPPFGVKASLANKFIDKALEFKPKLLILIVPKETERLDEKEQAYDLIWEDSERLTGKSFYLPGSIDVYDKQLEQWNLKPPLLYLWSRSDWTAKHKAIATRQGHMSQRPEESPVKENDEEAKVEDQEDDHDFYGDIAKMLNDLPVLNDQAEALEVKRTVSPGEQMEESLSKDDNQSDRGRCKDNDSRTDRSGREDDGSRTDWSKRRDNDIRTDQTRHEDDGSRTDWNTREDGDSVTDQSRCEDGRRADRSRREDDDSRPKHEDDDRQTNRSRREYDDGREDHESRRQRKDKRSSESFGERETEWEYKKQLKSMDEAWKGKHDRSRTPVGEFYDMGMPRSINSPSNRNDRSIGSPSNRNDSRSFLDDRPSEALETTSLGREGSEEGFLRFQRDRSGSVSEFGTGYGANRMSIPVEELDDIERRYLTKDGQFTSGAWSNSSGSGIQGLEGRFPSYSNDTTIDNFNRNPYRDVHSRVETFGGQDVDPVEKYGRSSADISRQIPLYGRHGPSDVPHRSLPPLGQDSGLGQTVSLSNPYAFSPLAVDPSRLDSSVTQRYAPRLDEMNYTRSSPFTPTEVRPSIMYNSPGSHAGLHSSGIQGFAAGPHRHFPHHNSSGWLND